MFRYIVGMSEAKSKIHDQIANVAYELDRHLLKLILYPGIAHQSHWSKEIAGFLNHVPKMKGSNKYPPSRFIYDAISIYEDSLADMKRTLVKDYNDLPLLDQPIEVIERIVHSYHKWISDELSEHGSVSQHDILDTVDALLRNIR